VTHPVSTLENTLNPKFFTLECFQINLPGNPVERTQQIFELHSFEAKLLQESARGPVNPLPTLQESNLMTINLDSLEKQIPGPEIKMPQMSTPILDSPLPWPNLTRESQISPSENELASLLAADIAQNKKLSMDSMIYFQTNDPMISRIKDDLLGNTPPNSYILKNNLVCKLYQKKDNNPSKYTIYIPTILLPAVIVYIHKHFLHTSKSQKYKEFAAFYYHPQAKRMVKRVCDSCLTCVMTRNHSNKNLSIGMQRTLQPTKPRQVYSMDILYLPTSNRNHTHALIIADLYSMYVSFFPIK